MAGATCPAGHRIVLGPAIFVVAVDVGHRVAAVAPGDDAAALVGMGVAARHRRVEAAVVPDQQVVDAGAVAVNRRRLSLALSDPNQIFRSHNRRIRKEKYQQGSKRKSYIPN